LISLVQAEPLIVGFPANPPLVAKSPNGEAEGRTVNQMKLVLDRAGLDYKLEVYPLTELRRNFSRGDVDVIMTRGPSALPRLARFKIEFGKNPFVTTRYYLYSFKGLQVTSLTDIKGKMLITVQGAPPPDEIKEFIEDPDNKVIKIASPNWTVAVQNLFAGRGDYLIMLPLHFDLLVEQNPDLKQKAAAGKLAFAEIVRIPIYLGISKKVDDAENLVDRLDHAIEELKAEGAL
jgi:ABC-type amino acid transport substrate-binding protein